MRSRSLISTVVLINSIHWMPTWAHRYLDRDLGRVEQRLFDILEHGIGIDGHFPLDITPLDENGSADAQASFLHAATNLINREGYIGASVEKIAAELGVSTGSFY